MTENNELYLVTGVAYEEMPHKGHISCLEVRRCQGRSIGPATVLTRGDVVQMLDNNCTFYTVYEANQAEWKLGRKVRKVSMETGDFLRSDGNNTGIDNLASLLEFDPALPLAVPQY